MNGKCRVEDCERERVARDLCDLHYRQAKRIREADPVLQAAYEARTQQRTDAQRVKAEAAMAAANFAPSVPYPGSTKPWAGVCLICGTPGKPNYNSVSRGGGACDTCARKRTKDRHAAKAETVMLAKHFQPNVPYTDSPSPWAGVCLICGQPGKPTYAYVLQGGGACPYCAKDKGAGRRVDTAIAEGKMLAADFQVSVPYSTSVTPWAGVCLVCAMPGNPSYRENLKGGGACKYCANQHVDVAVAEGKMLAADFEVSEPYPGVSRSWKGRCLTCGIHGSVGYSDVRNGQGACAYCAKRKTHPDVAVEQMRTKGNIRPLVPYPGGSKHWKSQCMNPECEAIVSPRLEDIQQGQGGCKYCATHGFDHDGPGYLYLTRSVCGQWQKIGIAGDVNQRIQQHGITIIIDVWSFETGADAADTESRILTSLRNLGIPMGEDAGLTNKQDGYSEMWATSQYKPESIGEMTTPIPAPSNTARSEQD